MYRKVELNINSDKIPKTKTTNVALFKNMNENSQKQLGILSTG
jgi:hypothetical protein